ncbi:MAG: hypothetical protein D6731_21745 [Planctomycetota bacterium]|nr:MAG: hypothetical protein D6731_21745 [Planctomycetota bacterium]
MSEARAPSPAPARPDEEERGEVSLWTALSILRRYWRLALLTGLASGLLVHLSIALWTRRAPTTYAASFEVRYRAGANVLAGLSRLVGRDLPSLRDRSSVETQLEIFRSQRIRRAALRRVSAFENLDDEALRERARDFEVRLEHRANTDIIRTEVRGHDLELVEEYAAGLLAEYHANDVRSKRRKDNELKTYLEHQIALQEKKLSRLYEVLSAHRDAKPLEERRARSRKHLEEIEEALRVERRARRRGRDALLAKYTPEHPRVREATEALQALDDILAAEDEQSLAPFLGGTDAEWAALRADAFAERKEQQRLDAELVALRARIGERYRDVLRAGSDPEHVQREYRLAQETYEGLRRRLNQVELSIQDKSSDLETLSEPSAAEVVRPNPWRWSLFLGALAGLLCPFALESLMVTAHSVEDLERAAGLPVMALVPKLEGEAAAGGAPVSPGSAAADELRVLRTNIESTLDYPPRRLLLVAGAEPGEGKSLVASSLARVYAEMGVPTLLVDLDLRRPVDHELLRVKRSPGVAEVIRDGVPWRRAIQIPDVDNLHVLPAGEPVEDSGGLLATLRLAEVLGEMREVFSVVVCDSPALTAVSDASLVARRADGVVLVYALATTPQRSLKRTLGMLRTAKAKVLGVVANDLRGLHRRSAYRRRYYYRRRAGRS